MNIKTAMESNLLQLCQGNKYDCFKQFMEMKTILRPIVTLL